MSQISIQGSGGGGDVDDLVVATDSGNASPSGGTINLVTPGGGTQGIMTSGSGSTITVTVTPSGVSGSGQTIGAVTDDLITFAAGAVAGTYLFQFNVALFESSTPAGAGYTIFATIRTTGAAATVVGIPDETVNEEAAISAADIDVIASGNNIILRATGVALLTIEYSATGTYTFAS